MSASSETVLQLRQLLAERFGPRIAPSEGTFATGLPVLDDIGVPGASLTEVVSTVESGPGGSLLLYGLLHAVIDRGQNVILIDGREAFAPKGLPASDLPRLLWTRCRNAGEAIKAADLAIRDGNMPLVVVLLTVNPLAELRKIPATAWHRLQMLAEKASVAVMVFSPQAQVGCARLRVSVGGAFPLEKLHSVTRDQLLPLLSLQIERRKALNERRFDEEEICRPVCA
jgi:hypothetical protein